KKGSRRMNGESPDVLPTSHAKLHQLFLEESIENRINGSTRPVKLKRKLNGFPFDSKTGKSHMEKFLKTPTPDHNVLSRISVNSSPLKSPSHIDGESRIEMLGIGITSPEKELLQRKRSPLSFPDAEEAERIPSIDVLNVEVDYAISEAQKTYPNSEADNVMSTLHEYVDGKEITVGGGRKTEGIADGYQYDDIASEVDNYMDALPNMDSEMETDSECRVKSDMHLLNIENQGMESDANEEQRDLRARFSDFQSIGNSTATDDENSSSRKEMSSFSCSDSLSDLAENTPSNGDVSAKVFPYTGNCEVEIINISSEQCPVNGETQSIQASEQMVGNGVCIEETDVQSCRSKDGEPSCCSEENVRDDFLPELSSKMHSPDELDDEDPDILSRASLHLPNILELAAGKKSDEDLLDDLLQAECAEDECPKISVESQIDPSHSVASHREQQHLDSDLPELEPCDPDGDDEKPLSTSPTKFQEAVLKNLRLNVMEINESCSPEHLQESISVLKNLRLIADATTVPLSSDQHDQYSKSKSTQKINVNENEEDAISSPTHHVAELRPPLEQKVESHDDQFNMESRHDQDSESRHFQHMNVNENAEVDVSSVNLNNPELRTPLEQKVESQDDQFDVEYHHEDETISNPFYLVEQIKSPNNLYRARHTAASFELNATHLPSQPSVSGFLPQLDVSEQAMDLSSSIFPSSDLVPEASQINLNEMPPLPPLPPMQWRIGKVQSALLASERDLLRHNLFSFPPILPSTAGENVQLDDLAIKEEISQPSEQFLPPSEISVGEMGEHSEKPISPVTNVEETISTNTSGFLPRKPEASSEDEKLQGTSVISKGKEVNPPDTMFSPPKRQDHLPQHVFSTSEGLTVQSSSKSVPFPPSEDEKPNGKMKLPRPRNPLIDAVVAHDQSKSFNLKPAVLTRPSIQGSKTNLKIAAILEKANAIRQRVFGCGVVIAAYELDREHLILFL
ncbi:hypothetical protein U1Q18_013666, partial [Sarracenia purpurea var. burkii]